MISDTALDHVRSILLDVEGTVTPIWFVHDVLFPFARARVPDFLEQNASSEEVQADVARLRKEYEADRQTNGQPPEVADWDRSGIESVVAYINWLIDLDRKSPALKSLQGKIWRQGYLDGSLKAPLYADVAPALERWQRQGISINIFSSGSVLAQRLLFEHTVAGDLTRYISGYFDTAVGNKTDVNSYIEIAARLAVPADQMLFISDVDAELDAAGAAGMKALLCIRLGNASQPPNKHKEIRDFDEIG